MHKHPKELYILALSEMCERFAFWGVGNLLVLYLTQYYHFDTVKATSIYGIFTGFAAFLPLIGGFIADRWNYQTPMFLGAAINAVGCFLLAAGYSSFLYVALFIIACGFGIFTPSILTVLGYAYRDKPEIREAGFSIYYASINVGVFLALATLGYIAQYSTWRVAFFVAGLVQVIGLLPIAYYLKKHKATYRGLKEMQKSSFVEKKPFTKEEKGRLTVIFTLSFFSILFWIAYNQAFSSMELFANNDTNRLIHGWTLPTGWILSSESFFLILLAPLLTWLYPFLQKRNKDPSPSMKTAMSLTFIALSFVVMVIASTGIPASAKSASVTPFYLIFSYFLMAIGEMLLAPIGLSMVTQLAPRRLTAMLVGLWYVCVGFAFTIGGTMAGLMNKVGGLFHFFAIFIFLTLIPSIILALFARKLTRLSHGHNHHVDIPPK